MIESLPGEWQEREGEIKKAPASELSGAPDLQILFSVFFGQCNGTRVIRSFLCQLQEY